MSEKNGFGVDKISRYGWVIKDRPGRLMHIDKRKLCFPEDYQRDPKDRRVREIASEWSWVGCGAIVVAERDNKFWVIDGWHRVSAANSRSDIQTMPCVVFAVQSIKDEAQGFTAINRGRKPPSAIEQQKAMVVSGDDISIFVAELFRENGLQLVTAPKASGDIACIALAKKLAGQDKDKFRRVLRVATELSTADGVSVSGRMVWGLWMLNEWCGGVDSPRFYKRLQQIGAQRLLMAAARASALYAAGGVRIWAKGMLEEINKGIRNKFGVEPE